MSKEQRQSSKLLELRSYDVYKNAAVLIITMLDHLELDMEVSDAGIETVESDNCRKISRDDKDTNDMFATIWEEARFFYKYRQKFNNPFAQSISRLC